VLQRRAVCLDREHGFNIVHNYAHGGSGFSFSWGCAQEAMELIAGMKRAA
jgi:D-amino-acid oxidase